MGEFSSPRLRVSFLACCGCESQTNQPVRLSAPRSPLLVQSLVPSPSQLSKMRQEQEKQAGTGRNACRRLAQAGVYPVLLLLWLCRPKPVTQRSIHTSCLLLPPEPDACPGSLLKSLSAMSSAWDRVFGTIRGFFQGWH